MVKTLVMDTEKLADWISVYLKGLAMGCAHAIPGISGGTVALITGIYGRLISAITSIRPQVFSDFMRNYTGLSDIVELFRRMDLFFLMVLGAGIVTAVVTVLKAVSFLISNHPIPTYGALTGLIAASALILLGEVEISGRREKIASIAGFSLAFLTSGYLGASVSTGLPMIFIAGMLAVSALILPGISGSLVLVIMGQYAYMSEAVSRFVDAVFTVFSGDTAPVVRAAPPVVVFLSGAIVGLLTVSHTVRRALDAHRDLTIAFLVSLVVGGLNAPISETGRIIADRGVSWTSAAPEFSVAGFFGALVLFLLDHYTSGIKVE